MSWINRVEKWARSRREHGAATLELVVLFPVVLIITFGIIEGSLWYHARNIALAAAEEGARTAARENGGGISGGVAKAQQYAATLGASGLFTNVTVTPSGNGVEEVGITVTGSSLSLFSEWVDHRVTQTAFAPVERVTTG